MELAIFVILVVIFIGVAIARARKNAAAFAERFPPLSDADFVARCAAGTDPVVALKVRRILSDAQHRLRADLPLVAAHR